MPVKLLLKYEVKPFIFVIATHNQTNNEFQIRLQSENSIKYQSTFDFKRAVEIVNQYIEEAKQQESTCKQSTSD
jgi:hypothetical protein